MRHPAPLAVLLLALTACAPKTRPISWGEEASPAVRVTRLETVPDRAATSFSTAQARFANLDFELLSHPDLAPEIRALMEAVKAIVEGEPDGVTQVDALLDADDENVRAVARQVRMQLHYDAGTYGQMRDQLVAWGQTPDPLVESLAALPVPRFEARTATAAQLTTGALALPTLELQANGTPQAWVWDTGADFTLLPESLAEKLGVTMDEAEVSMGTSTRQDAKSRFGVIERLDIGGVTVHDAAVLVLPDDGLRWEAADGEVLSLDGVLGWNVIRHTRTVLDFPRGRYTMELSAPADAPERNFFWLGYPIVQLLGPEGQPLAFGYDSGSTTTDLKRNFETKVPLGKVRRERRATGGAAGIEVRRTKVVDRVSIISSGYRFDIPDVALLRDGTANDTPFVELDGVLGSDIAQTCTVTLDAMNGLYAMDCQ